VFNNHLQQKHLHLQALHHHQRAQQHLPGIQLDCLAQVNANDGVIHANDYLDLGHQNLL